jgi:hypothetical protein
MTRFVDPYKTRMLTLKVHHGSSGDSVALLAAFER